jgi:hypothetical protein
MTQEEREKLIADLQQQLLDELDRGAVSGVSTTEVYLRNRIEQLQRAQRLAREMGRK